LTVTHWVHLNLNDFHVELKISVGNSRDFNSNSQLYSNFEYSKAFQKHQNIKTSPLNHQPSHPISLRALAYHFNMTTIYAALLHETL
jgi:hypothetical protein